LLGFKVNIFCLLAHFPVGTAIIVVGGALSRAYLRTDPVAIVDIYRDYRLLALCIEGL